VPAIAHADPAPVARAGRVQETRGDALTRLIRAADEAVTAREVFADSHGGRHNAALARQAAAAMRASAVAATDQGPPDETDVSSDFNTLRAVVTITRRIFDTALLPPHSRTLNNSVLKKLLETTAMLSNRTMKQLYPAYLKDDMTAQELQMVADAQLRKQKADVREYADRLLDPHVFLETELGASPFTAACSEALAYIKQRGGAPAVIGEPGRKPELAWSTAQLADVIVRYADVRGNIIDAGETDLMNRYNWYNSAQHAWGASFPDGAGWSAVYKDFEAAEAIMAGADDEAKRNTLAALRGGLLTRPFPLVGKPSTTASWRGATPPVTPAADWAALKAQTGWDLFSAVKRALDSQSAVTTSAPLTLFDVALLGGLHPRTFAMEEYAQSLKGEGVTATGEAEPAPALTYTYDTDVFFEQCMTYFDVLDKGDDLGETLFSTHLNTKSAHTSYMPFRRDRRREARLGPDPGDLDRRRPVEFGAKQKAAEELPEEMASKRLRHSQAHRGKLHARRYGTADRFALERYCDACFERGTEMYLRLVRIMIDGHLTRMRDFDEANFPPLFLRPLAKYIGLTIQRAELLNPTLKSTSVSNNRENRRSNSWALTEARVQLAQYCGFKPEVELNGYALEGPLAAPTRDAPAAPPGWAVTPGGPVWTKAYR
jgi:hypothetical protein